MTSSERRARCRTAVSVWQTSYTQAQICGTIWLTRRDITTEDPAEFFSMIFGGEAFVEW